MTKMNIHDCGVWIFVEPRPVDKFRWIFMTSVSENSWSQDQWIFMSCDAGDGYVMAKLE